MNASLGSCHLHTHLMDPDTLSTISVHEMHDTSSCPVALSSALPRISNWFTANHSSVFHCPAQIVIASQMGGLNSNASTSLPLIIIQPSPFGPVLFTQSRDAKHTIMGLRRCLGKDVHPFRFDCRPSLTAKGRQHSVVMDPMSKGKRTMTSIGREEGPPFRVHVALFRRPVLPKPPE